MDEVSFRHNGLPIVTNYELPLALPENPMLVVRVQLWLCQACLLAFAYQPIVN